MLHVIWAIKPRYVYQLFIYKFILLLYSFVLEETWWLLKWDGANGVASACTFDWKEVKLVLKEPIKNWYFFFFLMHLPQRAENSEIFLLKIASIIKGKQD